MQWIHRALRSLWGKAPSGYLVLFFTFFCLLGGMISLLVLSILPSWLPPRVVTQAGGCIQRDVILLHGLANQHPFGELFLQQLQQSLCADKRLVLVHLDKQPDTTEPTPSSSIVPLKLREQGQRVVVGDPFSGRSGIQSIAEQTNLLGEMLQSLRQRDIITEPPYHLVAHSFGGLVGLALIQQQPALIEKFIAMATPYQGTSLIKPYGWAAALLGAAPLIAEMDLQFQEKRDMALSPGDLAPGGRAYTIAAVKSSLPHGRYGELVPGWLYISTYEGKPNDGVLLPKEAMLAGAEHLGTYPHTDHFMLVRSPEVAVDVVAVLAPPLKRGCI